MSTRLAFCIMTKQPDGSIRYFGVRGWTKCVEDAIDYPTRGDAASAVEALTYRYNAMGINLHPTIEPLF